MALIIAVLLPMLYPYIIAVVVVLPLAGPKSAWQYAKNFMLLGDAKLNTLFGGSPKEYASSRVGRHAIEGNWYALKAEKLIDWIFGAGHCRKYIEPADRQIGEIL